MTARAIVLLLLAALAAPAAAVDVTDEPAAEAGAGPSLEPPGTPSLPGASGTGRPAKPAPTPRHLRPAKPRTEITLDDAVDMPSDI